MNIKDTVHPLSYVPLKSKKLEVFVECIVLWREMTAKPVFRQCVLLNKQSLCEFANSYSLLVFQVQPAPHVKEKSLAWTTTSFQWRTSWNWRKVGHF